MFCNVNCCCGSSIQSKESQELSHIKDVPIHDVLSERTARLTSNDVDVAIRPQAISFLLQSCSASSLNSKR